jgi:hypothetical protein
MIGQLQLGLRLFNTLFQLEIHISPSSPVPYAVSLFNQSFRDNHSSQRFEHADGSEQVMRCLDTLSTGHTLGTCVSCHGHVDYVSTHLQRATANDCNQFTCP